MLDNVIIPFDLIIKIHLFNGKQEKQKTCLQHIKMSKAKRITMPHIIGLSVFDTITKLEWDRISD